jgi:N-acetylmuramoyl-L-alanine amidase
MTIITLHSPNRDDRAEHASITMLVLHYTGMQSAQEAIDRLCDRTAQVSAHYVVDEDGSIYQLVPEEDRAWHAGKSHWRGHERINDWSVGIEIVNPGHEFGYRPFPDSQMQALKDLSLGIIARHGIAARNVVGHSDIAPDRKEDPGELFDWAWLSECGVGLWPGITPEQRGGWEGSPQAIRELQEKLATYGYGITATGEMDATTIAVITAFQRHFRQGILTGMWDGDCEWRLNTLLVMAK